MKDMKNGIMEMKTEINVTEFRQISYTFAPS